MFTLLPKDPKETIYALLIGLGGTLRFFNLGFHDLQAWDESLYTVRAEGILRFGNWVDQSAYAIDGLYSALHPPLHVWLTAISLSLFGINEFAARFVSALFGLATPFVIYAIGKQIDKPETGFFAALLFSMNPFVSFFARQGQFDTSMVFFITFGFYFILRSTRDQNLRGHVVAGIMVGLALMTKLFVGLGVLLAYGAWIAAFRKRPDAPTWRHFWVTSATSALVSLPWHVFMTIAHGGGNPLFLLTESAVLQRAVFGVEGNIKPLEIFYFVNQLFVLFPFGAPWFLYGIWRTFKSRDLKWSLAGFWFLIFFLVFSLMRTKLAVYLLPVLVPASLLAAREIGRATEVLPKTLAFLVSGTFVSFLWSWNQAWRNSVKSVLMSIVQFSFPEISDGLAAASFVFAVLFGTGVMLLLAKKEKLAGLAPAIPLVLFMPLFVLVSHEVLITDRTQYKDGSTELGFFVTRYGIGRIVVAGYERNPQLTFYLRGADIGWRDDLSIRRIEPPADRTLFRQWLAQEMTGEPSGTLLVLEKDKFIRYETIHPPDIVPEGFQPVFESRRYSGYLLTTSDFLAFSQSNGTAPSLLCSGFLLPLAAQTYENHRRCDYGCHRGPGGRSFVSSRGRCPTTTFRVENIRRGITSRGSAKKEDPDRRLHRVVRMVQEDGF